MVGHGLDGILQYIIVLKSVLNMDSNNFYIISR